MEEEILFHGDVNLKEQLLINMKEIDKNAIGTIRGYGRVLQRFGKYEDEFNKDVYNFSMEELDTMLYGLQIGSSADAGRIGSILKKYLTYAHSKNLGNLSLNFQSFFNKKQLDKYVWKNREEKKIFSLEQVKDIESHIINIRDKVALWLFWLGIRGDKNSEIIMLKKSDVDLEKGFITTNQKIIENIPQHILDLIKKNNETDEYFYIRDNGMFSNRTSILRQNDFLLRPLLGSTRKNHTFYITDSTLRNTFSHIKKSFKNKYPEFSPLNIYKSGMLYYFNIYLQKNNIEKVNKQAFNDFVVKYYSDIKPTDSLYYMFMKKYNIIKNK